MLMLIIILIVEDLYNIEDYPEYLEFLYLKAKANSQQKRICYSNKGDG